MIELAQLTIVAIVALWIGYRMRKNDFEEEIKALNTELTLSNKTVFGFLTEVNAEIADSRMERGGLMIQLDAVVESIKKYEESILRREKKSNRRLNKKIPKYKKKNLKII